MDNKTKLFFVVDSEEMNEEIFETLEEAESYFLSVIGTDKKARIRIAMVRNYYKESINGGKQDVWNYEDRSNTFTFIKTL